MQLSDDLIEILDERAASEGKSRSAVIREAIEKHVEADRVRQYVEAYRRMPQTEEEMEWADAASEQAFRLLDEEDPWPDAEEPG